MAVALASIHDAPQHAPRPDCHRGEMIRPGQLCNAARRGDLQPGAQRPSGKKREHDQRNLVSKDIRFLVFPSRESAEQGRSFRAAEL
jgi:uncharacterized radical SAM superfamily protein